MTDGIEGIGEVYVETIDVTLRKAGILESVDKALQVP